MYLIGMATGIFGESFVRGSLIVAGDATQTAQNIIRSEPLFRISIATDLFAYTSVVVLTWALFVLLRPVNRDLVFLAVLFRIAEVATHFVATLNSLVVLRYLSGGEYLASLDANQLHTLARVAVSAQGAGLNTGFILTGLGSTVFAYLLLKSGYVPKPLAAWGVFSSLLLATYAMSVVVSPAVGKYWVVAMAPMGVYEITLGFWLLLRGAAITSSSVSAA
ncbi:MAG: DUF4386 family protein [Gemmatimonadetes bacterium]|nr:DUF4386 domain-containing protein [Gemmatimonadota bacterium]NIV24384.1 DUF4386 family protein [Gemmatimonadota bacterium]NIW37384.1 DUF4386 family protein [Gemmatimonadota bacterium]NIY36259.1 DUF4386 family protein [Gemmatimonadota bacterium]